jgi:serralysin
LSAATNVDRIVDFTLDQDVIELAQDIFTALALGTLAANAFAVGTAAATRTQHIIYNDVNGALSYDPDGSGVRAAVQFALLTPNLNLSNVDFAVV